MKTTDQLELEALGTLLRRATGLKGCKYVSSSASFSGRFSSLVVNADAVIASATTASGADLLALWGVGANTVSKGTLLTIDADDPGASIAITSGDVIVYFE